MPAKYKHQSPEVKATLKKIKELTERMRTAPATHRYELDAEQKILANKLYRIA